MAGMLPDSDSEDELAAGWEERATGDGRVYYANHTTKTTQWTHPRTGKKKRVLGEFPFGWEKKITEDGKVFFVDHQNQKTTYTDPRLAFAVEEKDSPTDFRQRFDASTMALQILHGRDLSGIVSIVTGANGGIGFETARSLAFHGARVIFACRNISKAEAAIKKITSERPNAHCEAIELNLSSLRSTKAFVTNFALKYNHLHILILNASVMSPPFEITGDGFETTFQVNHLAHFYLTMLLKPYLLKGRPSRIVVLSSESHRFSLLTHEKLSESYLSPVVYRQYYGMLAYNDSKLCNVLFSKELNSRWQQEGIMCNSVHPGNMVSSNLASNWWVYRLLFAFVRPFTKSLQQAASTTIYCATVPELDGVGGFYFNNCCRCPSSATSEDETLSRSLWDLSVNLIERAMGKAAFQDNRDVL